MTANVPEKPGLEGLEQKWGGQWEADGTFRFDRRAPRERVYSIDPLTVGGGVSIE